MNQKLPTEKAVAGDKTGLDKHWHLAETEHEIALTEIEFAIFRNFSAFTRWTDDLSACCRDEPNGCNGNDYSILCVIRMHDRPKSISEIARLFNRTDLSNLQYSIKKLTKAGLIEKMGAAGYKKNATYQVTETGVAATERYADLRRDLLVPLTRSLADSDLRMEQVSQVLSLLAGIYDQAACVASSHRVTPDGVDS